MRCGGVLRPHLAPAPSTALCALAALSLCAGVRLGQPAAVVGPPRNRQREQHPWHQWWRQQVRGGGGAPDLLSAYQAAAGGLAHGGGVPAVGHIPAHVVNGAIAAVTAVRAAAQRPVHGSARPTGHAVSPTASGASAAVTAAKAAQGLAYGHSGSRTASSASGTTMASRTTRHAGSQSHGGAGPTGDFAVPMQGGASARAPGYKGFEPFEVSPTTGPGHPEQKAVWVHAAFPRCGSSTVMSLVEASRSPTERVSGDVFALFEPCHSGDLSKGVLMRSSRTQHADWDCAALLKRVLRCDFTDVSKLWGYDNPHSLHRGSVHYTHLAAQRACQRAGLVTFKTAGKSMLQPEGSTLLGLQENLHILDVVRDPRAIVASWRRTPGMNLSNATAAGPGLMLQICRDYAAAMGAQHDRLHRVVYEDLVRKPGPEMRRLFQDLGFPFGVHQQGWITRTFQTVRCDNKPYADCRTNSTGHLESWRERLPTEEQEVFASDADCAKVANKYGWPLP
mmetsp:Transcript_72945/g.225582  ORF Transcript_72945/g.225582 Transcript_72945/m.225582 type:complete len:506 (-) Transcript_72945:21-1538(-)